MNKKVFYMKLKNKQYNDCIEILRKEIIDCLVSKIKEKDSYFSFSTTRDLYNAAKKYLEERYHIIAYQLYNFDIMDESEEYVLDELLQRYKELKQIQ